jgi:signal transduction histidine kinase/CheY-like chemotaxis protein
MEKRDQEDTQARLAIANILQQAIPLKERCQLVLSILFKIQSLQLQQKGGVFLREASEERLELFVLQGNFSEEFIEKEQSIVLGSCLCGRAAASGELMVSDDCFCDPRHEHTFIDMQAHGHYIVPLILSEQALGVLFLYTDPYPVKNDSRLTMLKQVGEMLALAVLQEQAKLAVEQARDLALRMALAKSEFLANMSHEIRTPMSGVLGMLDILRDTELSRDQSELVETAHVSAEALLVILNDILDFSKLEAGRIEIEHIDFNLATLIEEVCSLLAVPAHAKGLDLNCFIPVELPHSWTGDANRIRQVLTNLIGNAVKFTKEGDVSVAVSYQTNPDDRKTLLFEVRDTGIGISPETQARLFKTFTQADSSTSRRFGGTGLGLSISKILVELMDGTIGVNSELGKGACFWFSLPLEPVENEIQLPELIDLKGKRALVVDDNANNRFILEHYVTSWGMTVLSVENASDALVALMEATQSAKPFEILLSDLQMPVMDGLALARTICEIPAIAGTPRLLLTSGGIGSEADYKALGFSQCLTKPVRQLQLFDAIVKALRPVKLKSETPVNTDNSKVTETISNKEAWPDYSHKRVLVAEDNRVNQKVILAMLARFHLKPDLAENGQIALDRLAQQHYDLVLMDCQMPIMDGYEATTRLRELELATNSTRTPVIALTAHATLEARETSLAAGMDGHLSKPISRNELADILARWLDPLATDQMRVQ